MVHAARRLRLKQDFVAAALPDSLSGPERNPLCSRVRLRVPVAEGPAAPWQSRRVSLVGESGLAQHVKEGGAAGLAQLGQLDDVRAPLAAILLWPALPQGKLDLLGVTEGAKLAEVQPAHRPSDAPPR
jgi:hypothetical protein